MVSFGRAKCDLSVVSDLKMALIPCCCRQRRRGSDTPLIYGKTAVDLNSVSGSTLGGCFSCRGELLHEGGGITVRNKEG